MKSPAWGLPNLVPDDAPVFWGTRAIFKNGIIDLVWDRCEMLYNPGEDDRPLANWLSNVGMRHVTTVAKNMWNDEDKLHEFDDGRFHIRFSARASHGYLYITAWMDAS